MNDVPATVLSGVTKVGYGLVLPVGVLLLCQVALLLTLDGSGSWDGLGLAVGTLFIVPGMLVANGWVLAWRWTARRRLFVAGLALPAVLVGTEFLWLHGGPLRRLINGAFVAPFTWVWLYVLLLFLPLLVSLVLRWRRVSHGGRGA